MVGRIFGDRECQPDRGRDRPDFEIEFYDEFPDLPDFGAVYDVEPNSSKEESFTSSVSMSSNYIIHVYDLTDNENQYAYEWEDSLPQYSFNQVSEEETNDGIVKTFQSDTSNETIISTLGESTSDEGGYVFVILAFETPEDTTGQTIASLSDSERNNIDQLVEEQGWRHNTGYFRITQSWIFGSGDNGNTYFSLSKQRLDGSDSTLILDNISPSDIYVEDGYIYFDGNADEGTSGIYKVRTSGSDLLKIVDVNEPSIQLVGDSIYYTPDTYVAAEEVDETKAHLYRCDLDGNNVEEVVGKPCFCWYVFDNFILYQDDRDNCSLHVCDLTGQNDVTLNDRMSFNPIFDGDFIYP